MNNENNIKVGFKPNNNIKEQTEKLLSDSSKVKTKNLQSESFVLKLQKKNNLIGVLYCVVAVFIFSISNLISKYLLENYKKIGFDSINLFMGTIVIISSLFFRRRDYRDENKVENIDNKSIISNSDFMSNKKQEFQDIDLIMTINVIKAELLQNSKNAIILISRCFLGSFAEIFLFFSFKELRLNTATTLYILYPIISYFLSYFFIIESEQNKNKSNNKRNFVFLFLCIVSVSLITKPDFIFEKEDLKGREDSAQGFFFIILSNFCNAFAIFFHKKIANIFNIHTINLFFGITFILFGIFLMIIDKITIFHLDYWIMLLLIICGFLYNISQLLFNISLKYGQIIVILPITYFNIVLSFIYNILFFNGIWDFCDIAGSIGIVAINVFRLILTTQE